MLNSCSIRLALVGASLRAFAAFALFVSGSRTRNPSAGSMRDAFGITVDADGVVLAIFWGDSSLSFGALGCRMG